MFYTLLLHSPSPIPTTAGPMTPPPPGGCGYKEMMLTNKKLPASSNHYVVSMSYILLYTTYKCYCIPVCDPKK